MILYLTTGCFDKGGISRYARYQISALRELYGSAAVQVFSVLGPSPGDFEQPFPVEWSAGGISPGKKLSFVARTLIATLRRRPSCVWAGHVNLAALAHSAARLVGAKSVLNIYGLEVWSGLRRDAAWGMRSADLVISDCHFTARYARDTGLRPAGSDLEVLWDCVDTTRFTPGPPSPEVLARYGIPDPASGFNVLTLGRMTRTASHKGYERLLDVFGRVAPRLPEARLVFAGKGDLVEELRTRASAMGLANRVVFTGPVHEDDLPAVYRAASVFSLVSDRGPSRGEGIPLTPLEAAACGIPILVGNHDGSQEAVEEGVNGYVLDPFALDSHAERLATLASSPMQRATMGAAARDRVLRHHDYEVFRENQLSLLGKVLPS